MNVLWTKGNLRKKTSKDSISLHAHASGDGGGAPGRCCRLCGGDNSLRGFGDTYIWEGIEERYDQLLYDCFGVRVSAPSEAMICEWCVHQLRNTERFRALVHAAFDKPDSEGSSKTLKTSKLESEIYNRNESTTHNKPAINSKSIVELLKSRVIIDSSKKLPIRRKITNVKPTCKRENVSCAICKQRYPMMVPENGGCKRFVCSRCKKNGEQKSVCKKCNAIMPSNMFKEHIDGHAKADLRGKCRLRSQPKQPQQVKNLESVKTQHLSKYQCKQCPKKYVLAQHLAAHVQNVHRDMPEIICSISHHDLLKPQSLKNLKEEHDAPLIYQCDKCLRILKSKRALQMHYKVQHAA